MREQRSPLGFRQDAQAIVAATARCAKIRVAVWRDPPASPATAAHPLTLDLFATKVQRLGLQAQRCTMSN